MPSPSDIMGCGTLFYFIVFLFIGRSSTVLPVYSPPFKRLDIWWDLLRFSNNATPSSYRLELEPISKCVLPHDSALDLIYAVIFAI